MEHVAQIRALASSLKVTLVAHYYQRDEVYDIADITGDSLALARRSVSSDHPNILFCGVRFMGESVKILDPSKRVFMPRLAACAMADMIDGAKFDLAMNKMEEAGIAQEAIMPVTYINCSAEVKARVGRHGGVVCTSANAGAIMQKARSSGRKIFFLPDRCLAQNIARSMNLKASLIGEEEGWEEADILVFNGFCSAHQLFEPEDVRFYRQRFEGIKIAVHPECRPDVVEMADFVGSTSMIIQYVKQLSPTTPVAVGTEYNLVHRLSRIHPAVYVLSATRPTCTTMNETTLQDVLEVLLSLERGSPINEIFVDEETALWAKVALENMMEAS